MLSLNEIRHRAYQFTNQYSAQRHDPLLFWQSFLKVFGVNNRQLQQLIGVDADSQQGWLWKGKVLLESCPQAESLTSRLEPIEELLSSLRSRDMPLYHLLCDGQQLQLRDLSNDKQWQFTIDELAQQITLFGFLSGYGSRNFGEQDPINLQAAEHLGLLHDLLKAQNYEARSLETLLIRLLFCFFAEKTGIFVQDSFRQLIEQQLNNDAELLGPQLDLLFAALSMPQHKRDQALADFSDFPWIGSSLFSLPLPSPEYSTEVIEALLNCCTLDWRHISPAVFGSLFQAVMDPKARRELGAHYTHEVNILKVLRPLFLDQLRDEFTKITNSQRQQQQKLVQFQQKLASIKILDPACGCGNFLVIAYRELRLLELEVLQLLYGEQSGQAQLDIATLVQVDVDQMCGIELESFPAQIAQVALWLTDHQLNQRVSTDFGQLFLRLPLTRSAQITQGNALQLNWQQLFDCHKLNYIVGNPPFAGAKYMDGQKKADINQLFTGIRGAGLLDYVTGWYKKSAQLMQQFSHIKTAFVSTNSITQGEQVAVLWHDLLSRGMHISFAHRTFQWESDGQKTKAAVHCVIIGFSSQPEQSCWLFEYDKLKGEPKQIKVKHINPYLVAAQNTLLANRQQPLCDVPAMLIGNKPIDGGHYLFSSEEKDAFIALEPNAEKLFKPWLGSREFIQGIERWCLWLGESSEAELAQLPLCQQRVAAVREFRLQSSSAGTRKLAERPTRFHVENKPAGHSLIIPEVSSERRHYLPVGFIDSNTMASNLVKVISGANLYHFGILTSQMHMAWMRTVCGRLKSDYRYSVGIVYNNFPWPDASEGQQQKITRLAQQILDIRQQFAQLSLAQLYDPQKMPLQLLDAHQALDKAVDNAYGKRSFSSDNERVSLLFQRYQTLSAELETIE